MRNDLWTLLHPPYTLWHLSYVVLGAVAAPRVHGDRVGAALLAFFLAVGVGAHAFDELHGRPLRTGLSNRALAFTGGAALLGASAIGVAGIMTVSITLAPFVVFGAAICLAYNLELFGGRFHTDFWLAASWGGFSALTGWWVNALGVHSVREGVAAAAVVLACYTLTRVQRVLSTPVRELRRRTESVSGEQRLADGSVRTLDRDSITAPLDAGLRGLSIAVPLLAVAALVLRL